jgi:hypothetical protein
VDIDLAIELAEERIQTLETELEAAQALLQDLLDQRGFRPGDIIEDHKGYQHLVVEVDEAREQQRWLVAHPWTKSGWATFTKRHNNLGHLQVVGTEPLEGDDEDD